MIVDDVQDTSSDAAPGAPLRVLLLAEACNPAWSSVPLVGYNLALALARHPRLEVTVVTQVRNADDLDGDALCATAKVEYVDNEWVAAPAHKVASLLRRRTGVAWTLDTAFSMPPYYAFEREVLRRFGPELHGPGGFDLVHRVTPVCPITPSPLVSAIDRPMILGPLNGGLPFPREFSHLRRAEREWLGKLRSLHRLLPHARRTYRDLAGLLVGSSYTARRCPRYFRGELELLPENGVAPDVFPIANGWDPPRDRRFRFVSVGRLTPLKGFDMVIEAMAGSSVLRETELVIVGDGPERERLRADARRYGLEDNVMFRGWRSQKEVTVELADSHAFVFASVKDFGGGVVLEAMASGLPTIVVDYGGPADLVEDSWGIRVPLARRDGLVAGLRGAMERLVTDRDLCARLGAAAARATRERFTWDAKADQIVAFYDRVLNSASCRARSRSRLPLARGART
ncbi:MAG TPA: glycosyltransferase family 4 protein [Acidimicrobiales bacterium]